MTLVEAVDLIGKPGATFVLGILIGFITSRFTMSKSEKRNYEQRIYQNGIDHRSKKEALYLAFISAISTYNKRKRSGEKPDLDCFLAIATAGDRYFGELRMIADAIISNKIDKATRNNTFVPDIVEALQKNLSLYYETLQIIAVEIDHEYSGKYEPSNYQSLISVSEKYGKL